MLKFRNIVLFASSLGEFFAMNLAAPEAKRVHVESVILLDNNSMTEHEESTESAVFGGTDSNTTIGVDGHYQGFSSNENSTLHDKEISTTTEEESTLSADSVEDESSDSDTTMENIVPDQETINQSEDILKNIPVNGIGAFRGKSHAAVRESIKKFSIGKLYNFYYSDSSRFISDLMSLNDTDDELRDVLFGVANMAYGFLFVDSYSNADRKAIEQEFKKHDMFYYY